MKKAFIAVVLSTALLAGVAARPASATIHEIVAAWCNGKGQLLPPGVSRPDTSNFAQPVFAGGVASLTPYLDGLLIDFDFDRPQAKISAATTGPAIVQIGPGLYLERFELDHTAFEHCRALQP